MMKQTGKRQKPTQNGPLRVLHITFNMEIGGTEQVIRQLVEGMAQRQVQSEILCIDGHVGPIGKALEAAGVPVHTAARKQGVDWSLISSIRKRLSKGRFDVVHCHQYTPWFYGWLAALATGVRVVFTEHGRFYPDRYRYKAMPINPIMALLTPSVIAISEATREALKTYEFIPRNKIRVIYNGIAPLNRNEEEAAKVRESLSIPQDAFLVGTVSRLDPVKNQEMMLKAFSHFLGKHSDSYLLMVGDGPEKSRLVTLASRYGIREHVIFTGFIDTPVNHLAAMDLFLLSSHTEGTSMTLLEAMSLGIPAIATRVGGNPEIIEDGVTGKLTEPDDHLQFSETMQALFRDSAVREKMGANALSRFLDRFSAQAMVDQYEVTYRGAENAERNFLGAGQ